MTQLQSATIVHTMTTRTDLQTAPYSIQDRQILHFHVQWNYSRWPFYGTAKESSPL